MKLMLVPPSLVPWRTISESLRGDDAGECAELTAAMGRVCGFHSKKAADRPWAAAFRHMAFPAAEPFNGPGLLDRGRSARAISVGRRCRSCGSQCTPCAGPNACTGTDSASATTLHTPRGHVEQYTWAWAAALPPATSIA